MEEVAHQSEEGFEELRNLMRTIMEGMYLYPVILSLNPPPPIMYRLILTEPKRRKQKDFSRVSFGSEDQNRSERPREYGDQI